jgi:hypothetical protein
MADSRNLRIRVSTDGVARSAKELAELVRSGQQIGDSFKVAGVAARQGFSGIAGEAKKVAEGIVDAFESVAPEVKEALTLKLDTNLAEQKALATAKALRDIRKRELKDELADIAARIKAQKDADRLVPRVKIDPKLTQRVQGLNSSKRLLENNELLAVAADLEAKADAEKKIRALDAADAVSKTRQKQIAEELAAALAAIKTEQERQAKVIAERPKASRERLEQLEKELATLEQQRETAKNTALDNLKALSAEKRAQDDIAGAAATEITRINGKIEAAKKYIALQKDEIKKQAGPTEEEAAKLAELEAKRKKLEDEKAAKDAAAIQAAASRTEIINLAAASKARAEIRKKEYAERLGGIDTQLKAETLRLQQEEANRPPADRGALNLLLEEQAQLERQSAELQRQEDLAEQKNKNSQNAITNDRKAAATLKEEIDQQLADADLAIEKQKELNAARAKAEPVLDTGTRDEVQGNLDVARTARTNQLEADGNAAEKAAQDAIDRQDAKNSAVKERKRTDQALAGIKERVKAELEALAEIEANKPEPDRTNLDAALNARQAAEDAQRARGVKEETDRLARQTKTDEATARIEKANLDKQALDEKLRLTEEAAQKERESIQAQESVPAVLNTTELDQFTAEKARILAEQESDNLIAVKAKEAAATANLERQQKKTSLEADRVAADELISQLEERLAKEQEIYNQAQANKPAPDRSAIEAAEAEYEAILRRQEAEQKAAEQAAKNEATRIENARKRIEAIDEEQAASDRLVANKDAEIEAEKASITRIETAPPDLNTTEFDRLNAEKARLVAEQSAADLQSIKDRSAFADKQLADRRLASTLATDKEAIDERIKGIQEGLNEEQRLYDQAQANKPAPSRSNIEEVEAERQTILDRQETERIAAAEAAKQEQQRIANSKKRIEAIEQEKADRQSLLDVKASEIEAELARISAEESQAPTLNTEELDRLTADKTAILTRQAEDEKAAIKAAAARDQERADDQTAQAELNRQKETNDLSIAELQRKLDEERERIAAARKSGPGADRTELNKAEQDRADLLDAQKKARQAAEKSQADITTKIDAAAVKRDEGRARRPDVDNELNDLASRIEKEQALINQIESEVPTLDRSEIIKDQEDQVALIKRQAGLDDLRATERLAEEKAAIESKAEEERLARIKAATDAEIAALEQKIDIERRNVADAEKQKPTVDRSRLDAAEQEQKDAFNRQSKADEQAKTEQTDRETLAKKLITDRTATAAKRVELERQAADLNSAIDNEQAILQRAIAERPVVDRSGVAGKEREKEALLVQQDLERQAEAQALADNEAKQAKEQLIQEQAKAREKAAKEEKTQVEKQIAAQKKAATAAAKAGTDFDDSELKALESQKTDLEDEIKAKIAEPFRSQERVQALKKEAIALTFRGKEAERAREKSVKGIDKEIAARQKLFDAESAKIPAPNTDVLDGIKKRQTALLSEAELLGQNEQQIQDNLNLIAKQSDAALAANKAREKAAEKENTRLANNVKTEVANVKVAESAKPVVDKSVLNQLESDKSELELRANKEALAVSEQESETRRLASMAALRDSEIAAEKERLDTEIQDLARAITTKEGLLEQEANDKKRTADRGTLDKLEARKKELEAERSSLDQSESFLTEEINQLEKKAKLEESQAKRREKTDKADLDRADENVANQARKFDTENSKDADVDTSVLDDLQGKLDTALGEKATGESKQNKLNDAEAARKTAEKAAKSAKAAQAIADKEALDQLNTAIDDQRKALEASAESQKVVADRARLEELQAQRQALIDANNLLDEESKALTEDVTNAESKQTAKANESAIKAKAKADQEELDAIQSKIDKLEELYKVEAARPIDVNQDRKNELEAELEQARKDKESKAKEISDLANSVATDSKAETARTAALAKEKAEREESLRNLEDLISRQQQILDESAESQKQTADRARLEELEAQRQALLDAQALREKEAKELESDVKASESRETKAAKRKEEREKAKADKAELGQASKKIDDLEAAFDVEAAKPIEVDQSESNAIKQQLEEARALRDEAVSAIAGIDKESSSASKEEAARTAQLAAKRAQQAKDLQDLQGFIDEQQQILEKSAQDQKVVADRSVLDALEAQQAELLIAQEKLDEEIRLDKEEIERQKKNQKAANEESSRQKARDKIENSDLDKDVKTAQSEFNTEAAKPAVVNREKLDSLLQEQSDLEAKKRSDDLKEAALDDEIRLATKKAAKSKIVAANRKKILDQGVKDLEESLAKEQALLDKATADQRAPILDEINRQKTRKAELEQQKRDIDLESAQGAERLQNLKEQADEIKRINKQAQAERETEAKALESLVKEEQSRLAKEDKRKPIGESDELKRLKAERAKLVSDEAKNKVADSKIAGKSIDATARGKTAQNEAKQRELQYKKDLKAVDELIEKQKELNKVSLQQRIAPFRQRIETAAKNIFTLGNQRADQGKTQAEAKEESARLGRSITADRETATTRDGRFARAISRAKQAVGLEQKNVKAADAVIPEQDQEELNQLQANADRLRAEERRNRTIIAIREERRLKLEGTQSEINEAAALRRNAYRLALADLREQIREQQKIIRAAAKEGGPVDRTKLNALEAERNNLQSEQRSLGREDTQGFTQLSGLKDAAGEVLNELKAFDEAGERASSFAGKIAIVAEQIQEVRKAGLRAAIEGNEAAQQQEIASAQAITAAKKKELSNQLVNLNEQIAKENALREKGAPNGARINELEGQRTAKREELKTLRGGGGGGGSGGGGGGGGPENPNLTRLQNEGQSLKSKLAGIEASEAATRGIQKNLETIANGAKNSVSSISQLAFEFNNVIQAAQSFAAVGKGVYDAFIGSNERLNQQLLASQTNLASSVRIFENGVEIKNPLSKQIEATRGPLKDTLKQLEKDTLELVGVTSQDVNELFQITLTNASELNNQSKEFPSAIDAAAKLTKGWAAGLQTIGLPLFQARQEINSILRGTIDQNSVLAKTIGISSQQVKEWKAQGVLVDRLNERLAVYVAGNKIAAYSVTGITSNIQDLVQIVGREAGEPLIDPLVQALGRFFDYLQNGREEIIGFFNTLTTIVGNAGSAVGQALAPLGESLVSIGEDAGPIALKALEGLLAVFTGTLVALGPLINLIGKVVESVASFATTDLGGFVVQIGAAALAVKALSDISTLVAVKTFPFFIAKLIEVGSTSINSATLIKAMQTVLSDLPGTAAKVGSALSGISTAALAASKAGIAAMGASIASLGAQFTALAAGGIPAMTTALTGMFVTLNAIAVPVAASVAALGALAAVGYLFTENWKFDDAQEALDVFDGQVASLGDRSLDLATKMKTLGKAQKDGTITPEQLTQLNQYRKSSQLMVMEIDENIEALKGLKPENDAQAERNKTLIASLEQQKKTLANTSGGIILQGKELEDLGTSYEQLQQKVENADRIIESQGGGKVDVFKAGVDAKIDLINQQVVAGQMSVAEGQKQLEAIANNKKVEVDQQQKANDAIAAIRKIALDQQLADIKTSQASTAAALATGQIDAVEAEKRNTEAKRAELQIQLDDVKKQVADEQAAIAAGRGSKVKLASLQSDQGQLESQLIQEQADAEKRAQDARLKVVESAGQRRLALASLVEANVNARIDKQLANGAISSQQAEQLKLEATEKRIAAELAAEQDKLRALQNEGPLSNQQDEADRQNRIIESQKKVADAQAAIEDNRIKRSAAAYAEVQRVAEKTANDITAAEKQQEIATQELINAGAISREDAELRKLNATKTRIAAELALEAANRAAIDASDLNPEEKEKAKRDSFNKTAQLQLDALQNQLATEQQIREKSVAALAAIEEAKNTEIQEKLNDGLINAEEAEAQKLLATKARIEAEIALEEAALEEKLKANLTPDQANALRAESAKKTSQLRLSLLQNEASIEEGIRAKNIAAIERESKAKVTAIEASTIALQQEIQALAPQEAAINRINASLDRQSKILQGNASLTNAINNLSQVRASGNAGILDKALSIKSQAASEEDPEKRAKLEQILASIGINAATTELELIKQKQAEENRAAQLKMEALKAEQAQAQAQLEIQLRQQDLAIKLEQISARRALIEAQISSAKAQQALLDAQAAKGKADQIKDPAERAQAQAEAQNAIATAKLGVEAAGQQTELAREQGAIADQAAEDQKASAIEQRKLLAVQQDTQTNQLGLDERQRKIDQSVTLVNAGGDPLSPAEINSANDLITQQSDLTAQAIKEQLEKDNAARGIVDRLPSGQNPGDVVDLGVASADSLVVAQDRLEESTLALADKFDGLADRKSSDGKPVSVKVDGEIKTADSKSTEAAKAKAIAAVLDGEGFGLRDPNNEVKGRENTRRTADLEALKKRIETTDQPQQPTSLGTFQQGADERPLTLSQREARVDQARKVVKPAATTALEHLQNQKEMGDIAVERDQIKAEKVRENLSSTPEEIAAADKFAADSAAVFNASILKAAKQFGIKASDAPQVDPKGGPGRNALLPKPEADKKALPTEPTKELPKALAEEIAKKDQKASSPPPTDQTESNPMASFIASLQAATDAIQSFTNAATNASGSSAKGLPVVKLAGARFLGGDVAGGRPYLVGEGGPELVGFGDGSSAVVGVGGPEIYTPTKPGYVYTAAETAALMRMSTPMLSIPNTPSVTPSTSNQAVVHAIEKLQAIMKNLPNAMSHYIGGDTNHFAIGNNVDNAFELITDAFSALNQHRRR